MKQRHRLLISTSLRSGRRRGGRGEEVSGSLLLADLLPGERRLEVVAQMELPESPHLPGRRSVRGVADFAGGVAACNTSQLFLIDRDLENILDVYSERRFGDIHSIAAHDGALHVTATASDCIVTVDEDFRRVGEWWAGQDVDLQPYMRDWQRGRIEADHDFRRDVNPGARFHMNHVCFDEHGDMLVSLPGMSYREGKSRVYNVTRKRFLFGGRPIEGATRGRIHDGVPHGGHYYLCRTATGDFVKLDRETGALCGRVDCSVPLEQSTGDPLALEHGWLRGAVRLEEELFLVGQSKMTLFLVDVGLATRRRIEIVGADGNLDDPGLAIYCIARMNEDGARIERSNGSP